MMEFHPVANIFPMMTEDEYRALVNDIAEHGQREAIWTYHGQIIDGRNRYRACAELGIKPIMREWSGEGSLIEFVVSMNLHRRHLSSSQKAIITLDVEPMLAEEARRKEQERKTTFQKIEKSSMPTIHAAEQAARIVGTNRQYVSDAKKISQEAPELIAAIRNGEKTILDAKRELKERERETVREANRTLVEEVPPLVTTALLQRYQTIVIDPPWDWGDEGDCDQYGRARPTYATMPIEEVASLPVPELVQSNAHIYLWITNRSLPKGFALLEHWGFRYVTALTWVKPSFGMGNYYRGSTEHVLFGVRGSLALLRHDLSTHFNAPRPGAHSGKPDLFYQIVESASPGPWLEMFSRNPRPGWIAWGAEASVDANRN